MENIRIVDNLVTGNDFGRIGGCAGFLGSSGNVVDDLLIENNQILNTTGTAIVVIGGSSGVSNTVSNASILGNVLNMNGAGNPTNTTGIFVTGGNNLAADNSVDLVIAENTITNSGGNAVSISGGQDGSSGNSVVSRIENNAVSTPVGVGIGVNGGAETGIYGPGLSSFGNTVQLDIVQNVVRDAGFIGIAVQGGVDTDFLLGSAGTNQNAVTATVDLNVIERSANTGLFIAGGGIGLASENVLNLGANANTVCDNFFDVFTIGGFEFPGFPSNLGIDNLVTGALNNTIADQVAILDGVGGSQNLLMESGTLPCTERDSDGPGLE